MAILPGTRLGSYEIVAPLGAGGMGEVYRARDTQLNRDVAIKVLPELFAMDAERLARFSREAQTLATLNHPNIAHIHGLEQSGNVRALVMELVEGEELSALVARGPIPLDEAIPIARQIAEALEGAHEVGVIHRDVKPANIKIRNDGTVKVLDFGLAKAIEPAAQSGMQAAPATITSPAMTEAGLILGTAAYMSPEQAKGRPVDRRADIWSFGVVLYEMLTGVRIFEAESVAETLGQIFAREPDLNALPARTPPAVRNLLTRCLMKDPRQRLRDIGEARILLSGAGSSLSSDAHPDDARGRWRARHFVLIATLVALAAVGGWLAKPTGSVGSPLRKLDLITANLQTGVAPNLSPILSPDGTRVLLAARNRLWIRPLDRFDAREVSGTEGAAYLTWAPDSRSIAFVRDGQIWTLPIEGSAPTAIGPTPSGFGGSGGLAWNDAGELAVSGSSNEGLVAMPANGGASRVALAIDKTKESDFHEISALPGGRGWIFAVHRLAGTDTIAVLQGTTRKDVLQLQGETVRSPIYSPTGHLIYQRAQTNVGLWAVRFSLDRLETVGEPVRLAADATHPSVSVDGTLAFVRKSDSGQRLAWVSRTGAVEPVGEPLQIAQGEWVGTIRLSRDGRQVAFIGNEGAQSDLWIYDLARQTKTRLTANVGAAAPTWTPDGTRVLFAAFRGQRTWNIYARRADGGADITMVSAGDDFLVPYDVTRDGEWLVYGQGLQSPTLWRRRLDGTGQPSVVVPKVAVKSDAAVSPDGHWLAYVSNDGGTSEVYVRPFPVGDARWPISSSGGTLPEWSADGRELLFRSGNRIMSVAITTTGARFEASPPRMLFQTGTESGLSSAFQLAPDGRRLLMLQATGQDHITMVLNLREELARLASGTK